MAKLSIVMPAKNSEKYLRKCLNTIIKQSFQEWELIFVNDHSTDATEDIVKNFSDHRIKYFDLIKGNGISDARNFGCSKAKTDLIVTADSDDEYHRDRLITIYTIFKNKPDVDVFYSNIKIVNHITGQNFIRPFQPYSYELLKHINYIPNVSSAYRKECFLSTKGYNNKMKMSEDYDFWLTLSEKNYCFYGLDKVLVTVNRYNDSSTAKKDKLKHFTRLVKRKHGLPEKADLLYVKHHTNNQKVFRYFTTPGGKRLWFE